MAQGKGRAYADRFEALVRMFPKDDGLPWRGRDIERATDGKIGSSYITALRQGNIQKPGFEALSLIARVMRFDTELWTLDSEEFTVYTSDRPANLTGVDERLVDALQDRRIQDIVHKSLRLSDDQRDMVIKLIDNRQVLSNFQDLLLSGAQDRP